MLFKKLFFLLGILPTVSFAFAGHPYVGGLFGGSFGKVSQTNPQIIYFSGTSIVDSYPAQNNPSVMTGGVNAGYEFSGSQWRPAIAVGLGMYQTGSFHFNGQVNEAATPDPGFTLYNYKSSIRSFRVMAETQLTWLLGPLSPFIQLGIGSSWNHAGNYSETAIDSTGYTVPLPPFQTQTQTRFAYQAGLGISWAFNFSTGNEAFQHERISLGYRYADLGQASFGTRGSVYPYQLNMGRLTTSDIFLSYTHLF